MSVLIKDMKMPKSCKSCDLLQDYDGDMYCPLNSYLNFGDIEYVPDYVMLGCPISEAPERKKGKWIKMSDADGYYYCCNMCGEELPRYMTELPSWDKPYPHKQSIYKTDFCPNCGAEMEG